MADNGKEHRGNDRSEDRITAREYLLSVERMKRMLRNKQRELEDARLIAYGGGSLTDYGERVQSSADLHRMERQVVDIAALEEKIRQDIERYLWYRDDVIDTVLSVRNSAQSMVLYSRYIDGDRLEDIAHYMKYNYNHVKKLHWKGVKAVSRILDERKKS